MQVSKATAHHGSCLKLLCIAEQATHSWSGLQQDTCTYHVVQLMVWIHQPGVHAAQNCVWAVFSGAQPPTNSATRQTFSNVDIAAANLTNCGPSGSDLEKECVICTGGIEVVTLRCTNNPKVGTIRNPAEPVWDTPSY